VNQTNLGRSKNKVKRQVKPSRLINVEWILSSSNFRETKIDPVK